MQVNCQLVFGADEFFVEQRVLQLLTTYEQWALETVDGTVQTIGDLKQLVDRLMICLQTGDIFSPQKCVWLRATNLLSSGSPATTEGGQSCVERLLTVVQALPDTMHLMISASSVDKRTKLFKTFQALAIVEEIDEKQTVRYLNAFVQQRLQALGMSMDPEACVYLFQKLNHQPRVIANELEKLAVWKNFTGTITADDVRTCTPTLMNYEFFEPIEAFYAKDVARYVRTLRQHFMLNREIRSLLVTMQNRNRLCIQLAQLHLPSVSKIALEKSAQKWKHYFGSMEAKSSFCVFSQNPWYLSRIQPKFSLQVLLNIQKMLGSIFDQSIRYPKQACAWMEHLVQFL